MQLNELIQHAQARNHRGIICLEGAGSRLVDAYASLRTYLGVTAADTACVISSDAQALVLSPASREDAIIAPGAYRQTLGSQYSLLVWDLRAPLHPDALAASSGTLNGGGLAIVLIDTDRQYSASETRFLNALKRSELLCSLSPKAVLDTRFKTHADALVKPLPSSHSSPKPIKITLNTEQQEGHEHITRVVKGHRHRPLIIRADRGRGKSTLLGYSAATLVNNDLLDKVIVVANNSQAIAVLQDCYTKEVREEKHACLAVWPSDKLLEERPETSLIIIDEAASFPLSILHNILENYARVVMASTLHGYEGSGRGFDLKLQSILEQTNKTAKHFSLSTPVRWQSEDPLERCINQSFVLDAQIADVAKDQIGNRTFEWLSTNTLRTNEARLREVFALLVLAHYQTRPSDLAMLLDDPNVSVGITSANNAVVGVVVTLDERLTAEQQALGPQIIAGERRLKGHLLPQALTSFYCDDHWLKLKLLRVMRIAVHPSVQGEGIGSELLMHVDKYISGQGFDGACVSFGVDAPLLRFWQTAAYRCLRLGYRPDASSGLVSAMLIKPATDSASALISRHEPHFYRHFVLGLNHYYANTTPAIVRQILCDAPVNTFALRSEQAQKLRLFSQNNLAEWDCWPELQSLALAACKLSDKQAQERTSELIERVLLSNNLSESRQENVGKKQRLKRLREVTNELLCLCAD